MSFGWSASDVVLAAQFLHEACKALKETGGSRQDYEQSINFIAGLEQTLKNVAATNNVLPQNALSVETRLQAQKIVDALKPFMSQIAKYDQPLTSAEGRLRHRKLKSKLEWNFSGKKKMHQFTDQIAMPLATVNTNLGIQIMRMVAELQDKLPQTLQQAVVTKINASLPSQVDPAAHIAPHLDKLNQVLVKIEDQNAIQHSIHNSLVSAMTKWQSEMTALHDRLRDLQLQLVSLPEHGETVNFEGRSLAVLDTMGGLALLIAGSTEQLFVSVLQLIWPFVLMLLTQLTTLGRRFPSLHISNSIMLEDALGRSRRLPFDCFRHWDMLQTYLVYSFQDSPGFSRVIRGHYYLLGSSAAGVIAPDKWEIAVKPGMKVMMTMLKTTFPSLRCPQCCRLRALDLVSHACAKGYKTFLQANERFVEPDHRVILPSDGERKDCKRSSERKLDNMRLSLQHQRTTIMPPMAPCVMQLPRDLRLPPPTVDETDLVKRQHNIVLRDPINVLNAIEASIRFLLLREYGTARDMALLRTLSSAIADIRQEFESATVTIVDFADSYHRFSHCAEHLCSRLEECIQQRTMIQDWPRFDWHKEELLCYTCIIEQTLRERLSQAWGIYRGLGYDHTVVLISAQMMGQIIPFWMSKQATIFELKKAFWYVNWVPENQQYLVYRGKKLRNDLTVGDYDLRPDYYVHLLLPIWGRSC